MKIKETLSAEFDRFSNTCTEDMIRCVPHYLKLLSSLTGNLPEDFSAARIPNLGCGNGNVTAFAFSPSCRTPAYNMLGHACSGIQWDTVSPERRPLIHWVWSAPCFRFILS